MLLHFLLLLLLFGSDYSNPLAKTKRQFLLDGGCADKSSVSIHSVRFPSKFSNVPIPWNGISNPKIFTSMAFLSDWTWFKSLKISGINMSIEDIISYFDANDCLIIFWGPAIGDVLIGKKETPLQVFAEASCGLPELQRLCIEKFQSNNCVHRMKRNTPILSLGNPSDPKNGNSLMVHTIDFVEWNSHLKMPERKWDFTVDALGAYDTQAGEVYLIDMTGHSADDVCGRIIGLSHLNKEQWSGDDLIKVLRYYLLEADGFISNDRDLDEFVNKQVRKLFSLQKVQEFYCFYIYNGVYQTRYGSSECHHPPLDSRSSRLLFKMNELLLEDLHEFYHNFIKPAVDEMKLVNVNQQAWGELSIPAKFPEANLEIRGQFRLENVSSGDLRTRMISTGSQHKREPSQLRKQVDENRLLHEGNRPSVKPAMKKDEPNSANSHSSTSLWTSILVIWLLFGQLCA